MRRADHVWLAPFFRDTLFPLAYFSLSAMFKLVTEKKTRGPADVGQLVLEAPKVSGGGANPEDGRVSIASRIPLSVRV